MISFEVTGSTDKTERFLRRLQSGDIYASLDRYGAMGQAALASATPTDSGLTAASWTYKIRRSRGSAEIIWSNTNTINGFKVAIALQYGHGTGTGGYVSGRDYINPAIQPLMDQIAEAVWKEVTRA